ncbi:hypothetical protein JL720_14447 [Aureococcus anophagefferens]|nr:hypothetical protein JL720_14447 [Aureococcus anophagefferens]
MVVERVAVTVRCTNDAPTAASSATVTVVVVDIPTPAPTAAPTAAQTAAPTAAPSAAPTPALVCADGERRFLNAVPGFAESPALLVVAGTGRADVDGRYFAVVEEAERVVGDGACNVENGLSYVHEFEQSTLRRSDAGSWAILALVQDSLTTVYTDAGGETSVCDPEGFSWTEFHESVLDNPTVTAFDGEPGWQSRRSEALTDSWPRVAFACGDVLVVDGLGEGATCYFEDAYTLRVVPGAASAAAPGGRCGPPEPRALGVRRAGLLGRGGGRRGDRRPRRRWSRDPDVAAGAPAALAYAWSCVDPAGGSCGAASTATFAFTPPRGRPRRDAAVSGGGRAEATAELDAAVVVDPRGVPDVGVVTAFERATASGLCKFQADAGRLRRRGHQLRLAGRRGRARGSLASVAASPASGDVFAYRLVSLDVPCDALTAAGGPYGMELGQARGRRRGAAVRYAPASPPKAGELRRAEAWVDAAPPDLGAVEEAAAEAIEEALETDDVDELVNAIHQTATMLRRLAASTPRRRRRAADDASADDARAVRDAGRADARARDAAADDAVADDARAVEVVAELIDAFEAVVELQADTVDEQETINTRAMIADAVTADVEALEAQAPEEQDAHAATVADVVSSLRDVPVAADAAASFLKTLGRLDGLGLFAGARRLRRRLTATRGAPRRRRRLEDAGDVWLAFAAVGHALDRRFEKREAAREAAAATKAATKARRPSRTRSVHRAVLRASLPSVVTKHRLVRRTLRNPDEAEAKSFKELRLVLWTVYYNHSWFSIASVYSRDHPRWRRCLLAFFETMIIAVCEAVTAWVSYPVGLCKVADDAASCENIRSSTSFGTDNNCRWDVSTEPECVFDPPRGSGEIFFMRLQMAVTMRLVLRQRQEIRDAIADLDDGVYDGAVAPPPRRGAAPPPAAAGPDVVGTVAAAGGATFDRRAPCGGRRTCGASGTFWTGAASPYRSALVALLRHHGAYWHLDPDASFWQRTFATRVHAVLVDSITVASRSRSPRSSTASSATSSTATAPRGRQGRGAAGADAVSPNARAAVGVVCLALIGMGYFMLFFARAYDRGSMQENWLYATVMTMFLIIFVFENLRSLILLIYLPALLVPKLRHIRDPLHVPLVPFRHETPVTPVQLVDVREARAVLKASAVPRRLHARLGTVRRESGLFVSTDDPTDVPRPVFWRAAADRWARFRDRLFEDDDELIVDADHDDRDVNRDFRRGHAAGWSLDNVRERLGYVNWERPRLHAAALVCGGFVTRCVMRLHQEFQELFLEETANLLTIIVASVSGEVFDVFRRAAAPLTEARRCVPERAETAFQQNIHVRFDRESSLASRPGDGDDDAGDGAAPDDDDDDDALAATPRPPPTARAGFVDQVEADAALRERRTANARRFDPET